MRGRKSIHCIHFFTLCDAWITALEYFWLASILKLSNFNQPVKEATAVNCWFTQTRSRSAGDLKTFPKTTTSQRIVKFLQVGTHIVCCIVLTSLIFSQGLARILGDALQIHTWKCIYKKKENKTSGQENRDICNNNKINYLSDVYLDRSVIFSPDNSVAGGARNNTSHFKKVPKQTSTTGPSCLQDGSWKSHISKGNSPFSWDVKVHKFTCVVLHVGASSVLPAK